MTRLRISAHRLEIEIGRRNGAARAERICTWCDITLGVPIIENEIHFLDQCDLNASKRRVLFDKLTHLKTQTSTATPPYNITQYINNTSEFIPISDEAQGHATRLIARFVSYSFKNREDFLDSMKKQ